MALFALWITHLGVAKPISGPWPDAFPAKDHCSNCGLCSSAVGVTHVAASCAFLDDGWARAPDLERAAHGRPRNYDDANLDEAHWGVHSKIVLARGAVRDAQWTGVTTAVALAWLEAGRVDAVVVAASEEGSSFGAPSPLLARTAEQVLRGRGVKPSLCPSLAVLDQVRDDSSIRRLLFCGVGCSVHALRAMGGGDPEAALGLEAGGLFVLGTHCVDNSPTPEAARRFVSAIPGVLGREDDVVSYEFMSDFRVHARLRTGDDNEETVKQAYMTLPPSIGVPSIAPSCFACFDYTNGLADLVVGYMGAPFDASTDEMSTAPLMVTVRNSRGQAMLDAAVAVKSVEVLQDGGPGGRTLPSSGSREALTMKTVASDSMVRSLLDPTFSPANVGAPPLLGNLLARLIRLGLPTGLEFGRFSIDYHYLRNLLYVERRRGEQASRQVPAYARVLLSRYERDFRDLEAKYGGKRVQASDAES